MLRGDARAQRDAGYAAHTTKGNNSGAVFPVRTVRTARYRYVRWGAAAKAGQLQKDHPQLLARSELTSESQDPETQERLEKKETLRWSGPRKSSTM